MHNVMALPLRPSNSVEHYGTPLHEAGGNSRTRKKFPHFSRDDSKENMETPVKKIIFTPRPVTPMISQTQANLLSNLEYSKLSGKSVSPNLAMLRMTSGSSLQEKQRLLQEKHQKAKETLDKLAVGGGVSLWPEMNNMRLTADEGLVLFVSCVLMTFTVFIIFKYLHGPLLLSLHHYTDKVRAFSGNHPILSRSESSVNESVMRWHKDYWKLLDDIQRQFETHLHTAHATYILYLILYVVAVGTLLYYLADNMIQKSRLTPRRIKIWVLLLIATASWTVLMLQLLVYSQNLEHTIEATVHRLLEELAYLATLDFHLQTYHNVATYWRFRCLPPTTRGTLCIFGIVQVRDVFFYLQYYSVPVLTALCTPVLRLMLALKEMYIVPEKTQASLKR
ncbi:hypothetical protein HHUSO_G1371 [Huso huso]|uniref:Uncharacterized protein n=2 Tax=Acipenseridae TaxID=7900 RepID=A0ABR1ACE3_HUSHU